MGGLEEQLNRPCPKSYDEMDEGEQQAAVEWLDYMEQDGPGWEKHLRGEELARSRERTPEEKARDIKKKPLFLRAICFAAKKHEGQTRKDKKKTPYTKHLFAVYQALIEIGKVDDQEVLAAAILHDALEDTQTSREELEDNFGARIRGLVEELTDDKSLPKNERKRLQIEHAKKLSPDAVLIKLGDKIANVSDVIFNPPYDWDLQRRVEYLNWAEAVVSNCPAVNHALEEHLSKLIGEGRAFLQERCVV